MDAYADAAFLNCGIALAQPSSAADRWPDSSNATDRERRHTIDAVIDRRYNTARTIRPQSPVSGIVTFHELAHQPSKKAQRELTRAGEARNKGDFGAAITYYQKATAIDPEFSAAFNDLGILYLQTEQLDLAIEQFNRAIVIDAHAARPHSNLAMAYLRQDRYADAEYVARRALDLDRVSTHGHLALGISLVMQKKITAEMERSLTKAASDFPPADLWLAIGFLTRGDVEIAKDQLKVFFARGGKAGLEMARALMQELELNGAETQNGK
jgi:tetratricopeptide (TPR) repeat protein